MMLRASVSLCLNIAWTAVVAWSAVAAEPVVSQATDLKVPGIESCRDLGGLVGLDGRPVRTGLVFRTSRLNQNTGYENYSREELKALVATGGFDRVCVTARYRDSVRRKLTADEPLEKWEANAFPKLETAKPGKTRVTPEVRRIFLERLKVRTEIDLRTAYECVGMTESPLGPSVAWRHIPSASYADLATPEGRSACRASLEVLSDAASYPVFFHCKIGRDRTGTLAFVLEGLLGVSDADKLADWRRSLPERNERDYRALVAVMDRYDGETLNKRIESFVLSLGVTREKIESLRSRLLE